MVDDEDGIRWVVAEVLRSLGYEPVPAIDGQEALEIFRSGPEDFCAIVLDVVMPRMRGDELYRRVRVARPTQGVVLMSAFGADGVADAIQSDAYAAFVDKPFTIDLLADTLEAVEAA